VQASNHTRLFRSPVGDAVGEATEQAIKKVIKEANTKIVREVTEELGEKVSKEAQEAAMEKVLKEVGSDASSEAIEKAYKEALTESVESAAGATTKKLIKKETLEAAAKKAGAGATKLAFMGAGVWILNNAAMGLVDNVTGGGSALDPGACGDKMKEAYPDLEGDELAEKIDECVAEVGNRIALLGTAAIGVAGLVVWSLVSKVLPSGE
jgi:histone H3/H4